MSSRHYLQVVAEVSRVSFLKGNMCRRRNDTKYRTPCFVKLLQLYVLYICSVPALMFLVQLELNDTLLPEVLKLRRIRSVLSSADINLLRVVG